MTGETKQLAMPSIRFIERVKKKGWDDGRRRKKGMAGRAGYCSGVFYIKH